ncbi:MAG TPA: glycosyltransferase family 4 protein [Bryobacteraceae bacterium]|jgi:glycosyltransferase involved in cell wall biosynthesis|nr:glycosyltransferase family 4 protein [Bryobacteraceae bacterium]
MRLLHVSRDYYPDTSGVAEVTYQMTAELARRGHDVWVATGPQLHPLQSPPTPGVQVRRFDVSGDCRVGVRGDVPGFVDFVVSGNWDAVTIHDVVGWPITLLLPHLQRLSGVKVTVNHSDALLQHPAYRRHRQELGAALRNVDHTVVLSHSLLNEEFYREFNLAPAVVIPNGVDLEQWAAPPSDLRKAWGIGDRPWLLTVSNHSGVKRHDRFFRAVTLVRDAIPEAIGTVLGRSHYASRFGLSKLGIRGVRGGCWYRCKFAELTGRGVSLQSSGTRADAISAIREADILFLTSDSEASPLVILESMAAGTPWISWDVGCVRDHVGGIVVNSCHEMAEAAKSLIENPEYRKELGAEGKRRVQEKHSWQQVVTAYEQLYSSPSVRAERI